MWNKRWIRAAAVIGLLAARPFPGVAGTESVLVGGKSIPIYPVLLERAPDCPSPFFAEDGREFVTVLTSGGKFLLMPVTVENGGPWINGDGRGKGRQLDVDGEDFPTLARTGLHSEIELEGTRSITGRSLAEITVAARPRCSSGEGFIAAEEDILSVLQGDNRLVRRLGLRHPDLARTLFHLFNLIRAYEWEDHGRGFGSESPDYLFYNGRRIRIFGWHSGHGWQPSIFDDEILGFYRLDLGIELPPAETAWLRERYARLGHEGVEDLIGRLTRCRTGEMAAFYIMRYGFYEGHTGYRADPLVLAFLFGLRTLEEIDQAAEGRLDTALSRPYPSSFASGGGTK